MDPSQALGEPVKLRDDCLPTKRDIYQHYLYLRKERQETGEWQQNTPVFNVVKVVYSDVKKQWDKTEIPHTLEGRRGEKALNILVNQFLSLSKIPAAKRRKGIGQDLDCLFDVAACQHSDGHCDCSVQHQVRKSQASEL